MLAVPSSLLWTEPDGCDCFWQPKSGGERTSVSATRCAARARRRAQRVTNHSSLKVGDELVVFEQALLAHSLGKLALVARGVTFEKMLVHDLVITCQEDKCYHKEGRMVRVRVRVS